MNPAVPTRASLPGTRPVGATDEVAASRHVRRMFSGIAPHYDLLNHALSLRFDVLWRNRVARRFHAVLANPETRILDLCCGTGDLTFALAAQALQSGASRRPRSPGPSENLGGQPQTSRPAGAAPRVFGADFAHPMLTRANEKRAAAAQAGASKQSATNPQRNSAAVEFLEADALSLPFPDQSFDLITTAFGFRNLANYAAGLAELHRVLRPGGQIAILEFTQPEGALFGRLFQFYFSRILPVLGGLVSGDGQAYGYLPSSVAKFPPPPQLATLMQQASFTEVRYERWTGGIVALHTAKR